MLLIPEKIGMLSCPVSVPLGWCVEVFGFSGRWTESGILPRPLEQRPFLFSMSYGFEVAALRILNRFHEARTVCFAASPEYEYPQILS